MGQFGGAQDGVQGRLAVRDFAVPADVEVIPGPGVLEGGAGRLGADGGAIGAVGVERRVEVDEVDAGGVQPAEDVQVVANPDCAVPEIRLKGPGRRLFAEEVGRVEERTLFGAVGHSGLLAGSVSRICDSV